MGVPEEEAGYYAEGVRRGGTLVSVRTSDNMAARAIQIMDEFGPVDVQKRVASWRERGWTEYKPDREPYDVKKIETERSYYTPAAHLDREKGRKGYETDHTYDTPAAKLEHEKTGGRDALEPDETYITPAAKAEYGATRGQLDTSNRAYITPAARLKRQTELDDYDYDADFREYDTGFRSHYDVHYTDTVYTYTDYQPAYYYGYLLASDERYSGRRWEDIEPEARRGWEDTYPDNAWEDFKDSVRYAWSELKEAVS